MLIIGVLILGAAGYLAYLYVRWQQRQQELSIIVGKRRHERQLLMDAALKSAELLDAQRRDMVASWTFQQLRENLQSGTVTCIEVLRAYQWKAIKAHEKTNCITMFVKEAEEWASKWDRKAQEKDFVKPAFFGIPISLKECVPLEGYDQTRGFVQDVYAPTKVDSVMVQHVKRLGMIPFVQTNVPQSMLSYSCSNPVYGTTNNPLDRERTSGGSSGGEAAIIAAGGSVIGIGGDVGGSIRIPCHFTGIAGIKPSHLRFSHRGVCGSVPGRPLINSNDGPMTVDIETTVDFLREVWCDDWASKQDPYIPPVLWNEDQYKEGSKYRIGYYVDDGWFTPIPAIQRAVLEAKSHLEAAGHTLVPFHPPSIPLVMRHFIRAVCVDGGQFLKNKLFNDIIDSTLFPQIGLFMIPLWVQRILAYPTKFIFPRLANMMHAMALNTGELRETYADIEDYRGDFILLMQEKKLDALLCPSQVITAPKHNVPGKLFAACCYTAVFNLLDFAAGVVKVTETTAEDDQKLREEYPETDPWYRTAKESCKDSIGYPVSVQVAAPPYKEETALRILRDIEIGVRGK
nr:Amidase domain containing protein [Haemonchus contortus]